ncbi:MULTISPECIES: hypothetical protein [Lysinibacillus]|nr:hypothetical protein [Lysinibacillus sp. LK3]
MAVENFEALWMFITLKLYWLGRKMMIHDPDELIYDNPKKNKPDYH